MSSILQVSGSLLNWLLMYIVNYGKHTSTHEQVVLTSDVYCPEYIFKAKGSAPCYKFLLKGISSVRQICKISVQSLSHVRVGQEYWSWGISAPLVYVIPDIHA
jgi:hypothetical protein